MVLIPGENNFYFFTGSLCFNKLDEFYQKYLFLWNKYLRLMYYAQAKCNIVIVNLTYPELSLNFI